MEMFLQLSQLEPCSHQGAKQEPHIMYTILCLAATHLSALRPQNPRYSHVALQLLGKSAYLFRQKLSGPISADNIGGLTATSILGQYVSWSHVEFIDEYLPSCEPGGDDGLMMHLLRDPLFQLSVGARGLADETLLLLCGSDSVFLSATRYSPRVAIEKAILEHGQDPARFVDHFMTIWDDPRYQVQLSQPDAPESQQQFRPELDPPVAWKRLPDCKCISLSTYGSLERATFGRVAERLSMLFCLVAMAKSTTDSSSQLLAALQPDIERCFFTFPVLASTVFRRLAILSDFRLLVTLCNFYRAARILLTGPAAWWARQRSCIIESLILRDLASRGLEGCVLGGT
jgi:hypothetical protein